MPLSDSPIQMPAKKFESDQKAHRSNNQAVELFGQQSAYSMVPAGAILGYGGTTAPVGFLECAGTEISRNTYAALFSIIGTSFGVGDGSTTFNIPTRAQVVAMYGGTGSGSGGIFIIRTGVM